MPGEFLFNFSRETIKLRTISSRSISSGRPGPNSVRDSSGCHLLGTFYVFYKNISFYTIFELYYDDAGRLCSDVTRTLGGGDKNVNVK